MSDEQVQQNQVQAVTFDLLSSILRPGADLVVIEKGEHGQGQPVRAKVSDLDEKSIRLYITTEAGFSISSDVIAILNLPDAIYSFHTRVQSKSQAREEVPPIITIAVPEKWLRVQRRANFRIGVKLPIYVERASMPDRRITGSSVNLSASGILININEVLPQNERVKITFTVDDPEKGNVTYRFDADVRRHTEPENDRPGHNYGLEFFHVPEKDQDGLALYLWNLVKGRGVK